LFQFPNVYQRWNNEHRGWQDRCVMVVDDPEDPAEDSDRIRSPVPIESDR